MRTILLAVLVLVSCQKEAESVDKPVADSETIAGFPLPLPVGVEVGELRNATTPRKPRHGVDAELEARVPGEVEAISTFFTRELAARGFTVESSEHDRVDKPTEPLHEKLVRVKDKLVRLVGKKGDTQVHVIITHGRVAHKLQIAVAGPL